MSVLLEFRERVKIIYGKYSGILKPLMKFLMSFFIILTINSKIGYLLPLKSPAVILGMSAICAFLPGAVTVCLAALMTIGHVYAISYVLAVTLFLFYVVLYCLFFRFAPKQSYIVLAFPVLYAINVPYVLPILLGLFTTPVSMVTIVLGVAVTNLLALIQETAQIITNADMNDTFNTFNHIVDEFVMRRYMMVSILIFLIVYLITFGIRKRSMAHASLIAVICAGVINIICFLISNLLLEGGKVDSNFSIIVGTVWSVVIAIVAQFFRRTLDYSGVKNVQFEDDEYYYYVKAVPKMMVSTSDKKVTRIHAQKVTGNTLNLQDEIQKAYSQSEEYRDSYKKDMEEEMNGNFGGDDGSD